MEIELQPAGRLDESGTSLIAPATVINYGFAEDWEAVLEGQGQTPLSPMGPTSPTAAGAFLKHVVVPGSLQDKTGPGIATEFGVLLPDSTGNSGVGASLAGIVSQRWDWGQSISMLRPRSHETIMATSFLTPSSKGRPGGRSVPSPSSSTRTSLERRKHSPDWSG